MRIRALTLPSPDPDRLARFYAELGFAARRTGDGWLVQLGRTAVSVVAGPRPTGSHHLALMIPASVLSAARTWLGSAAVLWERAGSDQFHFDPPFGPADSIYVDDPDRTLLELIARELEPPDRGRRADAPRDPAFDPVRDVLGVGEVAVPVDSVSDTVAQLRRVRGLTAVLESAGFAAVGDHEGMIILVEPDRVWFPTPDRLPETGPLRVVIEPAGPPVRLSNGTTLS